MDKSSSSARPASFPPLLRMPGGVSWQASALNFVTRYTIKRRVERDGFCAESARSVVRMVETVTVRAGRSVATRRAFLGGVPCDVVSSDTVRVDTVRGDTVEQPLASPEGRVVLYLHGGGFVVHLPQSYQGFAQRIAAVYGATVYLPDYRLAPEHRHPAAIDDCLDVYRALLEGGTDPRRLCLMGDSAGGNLALVTLLRARDEGLPLPACCILISPGADLTFSGTSYIRNAKADPVIPMRALHEVVAQYVDAQLTTHPHVSPVLGDFTGFPPVEILVGSTEVLLDASLATAQSCREAGVSVELKIWHKMPHVFPMLDFLPEGRMAIEHMAEFFHKHVPAPAATLATSPPENASVATPRLATVHGES